MTTYERALQIYSILLGAAHNRQVLTYEIVAKLIGVPNQGLAPYLGHIMRYCEHSRLPPLTVLVVGKKTGIPGEGFTTFENLHRDREQVFAHKWYGMKPVTIAELRVRS